MVDRNDTRRAIVDRIPGYEVLRKRASGGQADVYTAIQESTEQLVAIKIGFGIAPKHRKRLDMECQFLARLDHPSIVKIVDTGHLDGATYIITHYVDGVPLDLYVLMNELDAKQTAELFIKICGAVSAAHIEGIVHRDLKPSNVLVGRDGTPHILDFGFAADVVSKSSLSESDAIIGTLQYMSPEQIDGQRGNIGSDIYALGVMLYESLCGRSPYPGAGSQRQLVADILRSRHLSMTAHANDLNPSITPRDLAGDLTAIVEKSLRLRADERYQGSQELAAELRRYVSGEPVMARASHRGYLLRVVLRQYRVPVIAGLVCVCSLLGGLILSETSRRQAQRTVIQTQTALEMAGLLNLASVDRDAGRLDQAMTQFHEAARMGAVVEQPGEEILRQVYSAEHRIAQLHMIEGRAEAAQPHATRAIALAEQMRAKFPGVPRHDRQYAFALELRGRMHKSRKQWLLAEKDLSLAAQAFEAVYRVAPHTSTKASVARAGSMRGECLARLARYDEALEACGLATRAMAELVRNSPCDAHSVDLAHMQAELALVHLRRNQGRDNEDAERLLLDAGGIITALLACDSSRNWDMASLSKSIEANLRLSRKRQAKENANH